MQYLKLLLLCLVLLQLLMLANISYSQRICFGYREPRPYQTEELIQHEGKPDLDDHHHTVNHEAHEHNSGSSNLDDISSEEPLNVWAMIRRNLHI